MSIFFVLQSERMFLDANAFSDRHSADGIDVFITGIDGDFRTAARFAGYGFQFDDAFVYFRYFQFKEALEQARMSPGYEDLGAFRLLRTSTT